MNFVKSLNNYEIGELVELSNLIYGENNTIDGFLSNEQLSCKSLIEAIYEGILDKSNDF